MADITYKTTWAQAQRLLIENSAFADDATLQSTHLFDIFIGFCEWIWRKGGIKPHAIFHNSGMDKEDALIVFEDFIRNAEKEHYKEKVC